MQPEPKPYVTFTMTDLWHKLEAMEEAHRCHARRLDQALPAIAELPEFRAAVARLDDRLRAEEARPVVTPAAMWRGIGVLAAVLGVVVALATAIVTAAVK